MSWSSADFSLGGAGSSHGVGAACGACGTGVGGANITALSGEGLQAWMGVTRTGWGGTLFLGADGRGELRADFGLSRTPPVTWR